MKLTYKYIYLISIIIVFLFSGCNEEFLEVTPQGKVIPTTIEDYHDLMAHPNLNLGIQGQVMMGDDLFFPDFVDAEAKFTTTTEMYNLRAYQWLDQIYDDEENDLDWRDMYHKIFISNHVIEKIDGAELGLSTESDRNRVKGWALCQRAQGNLSLVNLYAKHYNPASATTDLGIPLVFRADPFQEDMPRATVQEVYDSIESDLTAAIDLLPDFPKLFPFHNYRASKVSALALLARVNLYKGEWERVLENGQAAMNLILENPSAGLIELTSHDGDKSLWPFQHELNKEVLLVEVAGIVGAFNSQQTTYLSEELINIISLDDTRLELFSTDGSTPNGYSGKVAYYGISTGRSPNRVNAPTVPDVYLMLAEAHARLGNLAEAESHLSTLRSERIRNYMHTNSANADVLLQEIINERRIEHMFTGLRWFDIKRLNLLGANISISHAVVRDDGTETLTLLPGDNRFILQLPEKVILEFNPPWIQND